MSKTAEQIVEEVVVESEQKAKAMKISSIGFFRRHWKKMAIGAGVTATAVAAYFIFGRDSAAIAETASEVAETAAEESGEVAATALKALAAVAKDTTEVITTVVNEGKEVVKDTVEIIKEETN